MARLKRGPGCLRSVSADEGGASFGLESVKRPTSLFFLATDSTVDPPFIQSPDSVPLPPAGERVKLPNRYEAKLRAHRSRKNSTKCINSNIIHRLFSLDEMDILTNGNNTICLSGRCTSPLSSEEGGQVELNIERVCPVKPPGPESWQNSAVVRQKSLETSENGPVPDKSVLDSEADTTTFVDDPTTREADLETAMSWIRQEIYELKEQDRDLMRQLLELRACIRQLIGLRVLTTSRSGPDLATWTPLLEERGLRTVMTATSLCTPRRSQQDLAESFHAKAASMYSVSQDNCSPAVNHEDTPELTRKTYVTLV